MTADLASGLAAVLREVAAERAAQDAKWGEQSHPDIDVVIAGLPGHQATRYAAQFYGVPTAPVAKAETDAAARASACSWVHIAVEELAEAVEAAALGDVTALRVEALQLAAVCVQWVQAIDPEEVRPVNGDLFRWLLGWLVGVGFVVLLVGLWATGLGAAQ